MPAAPPSGPRAPHRRRRRRGGGRPDESPPRTAAPTLVPGPGSLTAATAGDRPLTAAEVGEMRQHLAFLRTYKEHLRLKFNATEDLLVNGQRDPDDRGACKHLLGKLDRTVIARALEREPMRSDAGAKARFLAGAVRVNADVGVLLEYLEALAHVRSRSDAAAAFAEVVRRIDFSALSATRLGRLLQVLVETFEGHERVQVLFGLLGTPRFAAAFDAAEASFPPTVADVCAPLRAVHRRLRRQDDASASPAILAAGVEQVFSAPDGVLCGYAGDVRLSLLDLALGPAVPAALAERAARILLPSLPRDGKDFARLTLRYAAYRMRDRADDRARAALEELRRRQPSNRVAGDWLEALGALRLGRIAVTGEVATGTRLAAAFWLDAQRPVWLRMTAQRDADRLRAEAFLQTQLGLPGVAPVVEHGVADGIPYLALWATGRPLVPALVDALDLPTRFALLAHIARTLRALALAEVALPDPALSRWLHDGRDGTFTLGDLDGAVTADRAATTHAHAGLLPRLIEGLIPAGAAAGLGGETATAVDRLRREPAALQAAVVTLDRAALLAAALR